MSDIKSSLTGGIAGLAATFLVSAGLAANAQAQQDNKIDTATEAVTVLYKPSKEINLSSMHMHIWLQIMKKKYFCVKEP